LLGTRGRISKFRKSKEYIPNVFAEKSREHSRKPEFAKQVIDSMFSGNKIELFARDSSDPSWEYWGNEVEKFNQSEWNE
jgi:N6-adenosine-specific RNA methylase IME4